MTLRPFIEVMKGGGGTKEAAEAAGVMPPWRVIQERSTEEGNVLL